MAEPVGITGTAAGLISLGLQLYGEISKYLSAVKGRQKDLDRARRHHQTLQMCVDAIAAATSSSRGNNAQTDAALSACVLSCESELRALEALVARLQGPSTPADGVLSAKLREKGRQYAFPFHRESIIELERTLESTNGVLQTALQTLGLDAVSSIRSDLELVQITQEDIRTNVSSMAQSVNDVFTTVSRIEQIGPSINAQVIANTSAVMVQQSEPWSRTTEISTKTEENTKSILQEFSLFRNQQNRFEEILTEMARGSANHRARDVETARLIAKPADLKTMCDAILQPQAQIERIATSGIPLTNDRLCPCVRRRSLQRAESTWGPMFYTKLRKLTMHHLPGCPWQTLTPTECQQNRAFGFRVYKIGSLLEDAIRLSCSLSFGAGGLSINHGIDRIATVSENRSPVFKIQKILVDCLKENILDFREKKEFAEECFKSILWCYSEKLGCPSDVDGDGATLAMRLMHNIVSGSRFSSKWKEIVARVALRLMQVNVPLAGDASALKFIHWTVLLDTPVLTTDAFRSFLQTWTSATEFIPPARFDWRVWPSNHIRVMADARDSFYFANVLECGSLSLSILRGDERAVSQTLETYPYTSQEVNSLGQTPCHIAVAVGNLRILKLVLYTNSPDALNARDNFGDSPVDYAVAGHAHQVCAKSQDSSVCNGCKVLEMVLNANCALYFRTLHHALYIQDLAKSTRKTIIGHLRTRREGLKARALSYLSTDEASSLGICRSMVLDENAGRVQRHLDARSCPVPNHLRVYPKGMEQFYYDTDSPVYGLIYEKDVAAFAWSQGFKDIAIQPDDVTYHPEAMRNPKSLREMGLYLIWQNHHSNTSTIVWGHDFMSFLGANLDLYENDAFTLPRKLSNTVFSESVTDRCSCYCSQSGCTPVEVFLRQGIKRMLHLVGLVPWRGEKDPTIMYPSRYSETGRRTFHTIRRLIGRKQYRSEQYAWLHQAVLRQLTFTVLGLTHTCCSRRLGGPRRRGLDDEDSEEIHEEEQEKLQLLENLMVEFTQECGSNARLLTYLQDRWTPRMQSVMRDLASRRLSQAERQAAEDVGVTWGHDEPTNSGNDRSMEEYMYMLRQIVPKHEISLPPGLQF